VIGRSARRAARAARVEAIFGKHQVAAALDLLELTELAWHDCYQEISPPDPVIEDILGCSPGHLAGLVWAARLAYRDLRLAADEIRAGHT